MDPQPSAGGPSRSAAERRALPPGPGDVVRQLALAAGAAVAVATSLVGSGALGGTPIAEAAGGALSADATLVAPAGPAFSIWSVIYAGLVAFAVVQALPSRRGDPRQRRVGWLVLASLLLNAGWILCVQAGLVAATVPVIVALLAVLVLAWTRLLRTPATSLADAVVVDGTVGVYLGWVSIATVANVAAALADAGMDPSGAAASAWALAVLVVAAGVGVLLAVAGGGRFAPAVALAWGLSWIAVGRVDDPAAADTRAGRRASVSSISASSPATSPSSGNRTRIRRVSRIASAVRS